MAADKIIVFLFENGKRTRLSSETIKPQFAEIGIGASNLNVSELSGALKFGARIKADTATEADDVVTKSQADTTESGLQTQIDATNGQVSAILGNTPKEQHFDLLAPQSIFDITAFSFSAANTDLDIEVFVDGRRQTQDINGALVEHFRKNSATQIQFSTPVEAGKRVTVWKQGTSSGSGSGGGSVSSPLYKSMISGHSATIVAGTPLSKLSDGSVVPADSDAANGQKFCGIAFENIAVGAVGQVVTPGPNIAGIMTGLSFVPGDEIFISQNTGQYTNDPNSFTGNNDSVIRVGVADTPAGSTGTLATDLIVFSEVILRPTV